ncbi:MAG: hypothetical protein ACXADD_18485 [Candidatus Thorarchaeota archaeon]
MGLTLSARADLDTRWKISKELAATLTFFLASGYLVVEAAFEAAVFPILGKAPDIIKLFIFPGVALLMGLLFIRRAGRAPPEPAPMPDDAPVLPEDVDEEGVADEEPIETDVEPDTEEPVEEEEPALDEGSEEVDSEF